MSDPEPQVLDNQRMASAEPAEENYVLVRATVNLPYGLERDTEIYVNPDNPRIRQWLEASYLIPIGELNELPRDS